MGAVVRASRPEWCWRGEMPNNAHDAAIGRAKRGNWSRGWGRNGRRVPRNCGGITGDNAENMEVSSCESYRAVVQDSKVVIHASIQHRTLQPFSDVFVVFWLFPSCVSQT